MPSISLSDLFSVPRMTAYKNFLGTADDQACLAYYFQTLEASSKMLHLFNLIEVILRNRLNKQIKDLALSGALPLKPTLSSNGYKITPDTWYESVTDGFSRSHCKVMNLTKRFKNKKIMATADDYIAQLDFGYYVYLLHARHADPRHKFSYIWQPNILQAVFPGIVTKPRNLNGLFGLLLKCDDMRNRLCHHEPMWKGRLPDGFENIRQKFSLLLEILEYLSPEMKDIVISTELAGFDDVRHLFVNRCKNKYKKLLSSVVFLP